MGRREFDPITSQAQFDARIQQRLARHCETHRDQMLEQQATIDRLKAELTDLELQLAAALAADINGSRRGAA